MAFTNSQVSDILARSYNFSAVTTNVKATSTIQMLDVTTLSSAARTFIPGMDEEKFELDGYMDMDGSVNALLDQFNSWKASTPQPITFAPRSTTLGNECWLVGALEAQLTIGAPVAGVVNFKLSATPTGGNDFGVVLTDLAAQTVSTNSPSTDNGALTSNGGVGHLHVTAYSGFTNVVLRVEHSSDNSTFATLGTFTTVTGLTSERLVVASGTTVNRYLRASTTVTGSGSITFQMGFARR